VLVEPPRNPSPRIARHTKRDGPSFPNPRFHACKMVLEGIVSKRKTSPTGAAGWEIGSSARACEAVRREAEEDWGR
jgi:hypothetical protein